MPLKPTETSIWRVVNVWFFYVALSATAMITYGANFGITYGLNKDSPSKWVAFDLNVVLGIIAAHIVIPILLIFGTGGIRQRVIDGHHAPLSQVSLCDSAVKRLLFFSIAVPSWKVRFLRFIANCLLIPGIPIAFALAFGCWASLGFPSATTSETCRMPMWDAVALDAGWKTVAVIVMYTMNYVAAHNDAQPELYAEDGRELGNYVDQNDLKAQPLPVSEA